MATQPDFTTQTAAAYKANIDAAIAEFLDTIDASAVTSKVIDINNNVVSFKNSTLHAWDASVVGVQLGGNSTMFCAIAQGAGGQFNINQNAYFDGAWKYQSTDEACNYYQAGGTHGFRVAASGTAGNTISWITAMTISSLGNVTLGGNIALADSQYAYFGDGNDGRLYHNGSDTYLTTSTGDLWLRGLENSDYIYLDTRNSAGTAKVGIRVGGATPNVNLYYDGASVASTRSDGIAVGTFSGTGATKGQSILNNINWLSRDTTSPGSIYNFYNPNGVVGTISVTATATAYNTTSDKRKKISHGEVENPFDILDKFIIHNASFNSEPNDIKMMVMAQDVEPHYPQAISHDKENDNWGADYGQFSPLALACIKDLNKRLKLLEAI